MWQGTHTWQHHHLATPSSSLPLPSTSWALGFLQGCASSYGHHCLLRGPSCPALLEPWGSRPNAQSGGVHGCTMQQNRRDGTTSVALWGWINCSLERVGVPTSSSPSLAPIRPLALLQKEHFHQRCPAEDFLSIGATCKAPPAPWKHIYVIL